MKDLSRILWGIVLILLGIIWGLNATGVTNIDIFFDALMDGGHYLLLCQVLYLWLILKIMEKYHLRYV